MPRGMSASRLLSLPRWSALRALLSEWRQRIQSRSDLEHLSDLGRLNERDLADMGLTHLDAFNETQKPFWEA
jgi:uncharacterized protein YjiS (DUF1127 family)